MNEATRELAGIIIPDTPLVARKRAPHDPEVLAVANAEGRAQTIWDGVALNSTPSIALYKEGEVALCTMGIGLDWGGFGYDLLPAAQVAAVVDAFPRLQMKQRSRATPVASSKRARKPRMTILYGILASASSRATSGRRRWISC